MQADNSPSGIKNRCKGEHDLLSSLIKESDEFLKGVKGIISELNTVAIQFKRTKVESETVNIFPQERREE